MYPAAGQRLFEQGDDSKIGGAEANYLWNNVTTAPDYALYNWVAGPIGNAQAWQSLPANSANDFTSASPAKLFYVKSNEKATSDKKPPSWTFRRHDDGFQ